MNHTTTSDGPVPMKEPKAKRVVFQFDERSLEQPKDPKKIDWNKVIDNLPEPLPRHRCPYCKC